MQKKNWKLYMKAIAVPKNIEPSICCAVELGCSLAIALICSGELDDLVGVETEWKHLDPVWVS